MGSECGLSGHSLKMSLLKATIVCVVFIYDTIFVDFFQLYTDKSSFPHNVDSLSSRFSQMKIDLLRCKINALGNSKLIFFKIVCFCHQHIFLFFYFSDKEQKKEAQEQNQGRRIK